jgi:hypothetical protein
MEWITQIVGWVTLNIATILQVVGAFAAIAVLTPNKTDDKWIQFILDAINKLGLNVGKAANKDE